MMIFHQDQFRVWVSPHYHILLKTSLDRHVFMLCGCLGVKSFRFWFWFLTWFFIVQLYLHVSWLESSKTFLLKIWNYNMHHQPFFAEVGKMQQKPTNNIQKRPPITKPKRVSEKNMANAHLSLFPTPTTLPIRATTHQTKVDIEAKARGHVETFTTESSHELPTPPLEVKMRGH